MNQLIQRTTDRWPFRISPRVESIQVELAGEKEPELPAPLPFEPAI